MKVILLGALAVVIVVVGFVLAVDVIVLNLRDIAAVGVNFWNVFWITLMACLLLGGSVKAGT